MWNRNRIHRLICNEGRGIPRANGRRILTAGLLLFAILCQGCLFTEKKAEIGTASSSSGARNQGNGYAYDRLIYVIISATGPCPDGSPLQSEIVMVNGVATLMRHNCQALPPAQQVQVVYTVDSATSQIIVVNGQKYYQIVWSNLWGLSRDSNRNMYINGFGYADRNATDVPPNFEAISKLDPAGNTLWSKFVPNNFHFDRLCAFPDGRIVVNVQDFNDDFVSPNTSPSAIVMLDYDGKVLWSNSYVDASLPFGPFTATGEIDVDPLTGSVYALGTYTPAGGSRLTFLTKFSSSGAVEWQRRLPSFGYSGLKVSRQGDVIISGAHGALITLSSAGETLSSLLLSQMGTSANPFIDSVSFTSTGQLVVTGSDGADDYGNYSQYIALLSSSGAVQWSQRVRTGSKTVNPIFASVAPDDSIYLTEYDATTDATGSIKVGRIIHLTATGIPIGEVNFQGPVSPNSIGTSLVFGTENTMWAIARTSYRVGADTYPYQSLLKVDISGAAPSCTFCTPALQPSVANVPLTVGTGPALGIITVPFDGPPVVPQLVPSPIPVSVYK